MSKDELSGSAWTGAAAGANLLAALLAAAEAGQVPVLVAAAATDSPGDAIMALDDSELTRFWSATSPMVDAAIEVAEPAMDPDGPGVSEAVEQAIDTLHAITILAHASIADPDRDAWPRGPEVLFGTVSVRFRFHFGRGG